MTNLLKAYLQIFRKNKLITVFVLLLQIFGCVLLLLTAVTFNTLFGGYTVISLPIEDGGISFGEMREGIKGLDSDEDVVSMYMNLEPGLTAANVQRSRCNFEKRYDFSKNSNIIIMADKFAADFSVGDTVELYGKVYTIVDFNAVGFSEVPILSLPDEAPAGTLTVYAAPGRRAQNNIMQKVHDILGCGELLESSSSMVSMFKTNPLATFVILLVILINVASLFLCYKYYYDNIKQINDVSAMVGLQSKGIIGALLITIGVISVCVYLVALGIFGILGAATFKGIETAFELLVYRMNFADILLCFLFYAVSIVIFAALYYVTERRTGIGEKYD